MLLVISFQQTLRYHRVSFARGRERPTGETSQPVATVKTIHGTSFWHGTPSQRSSWSLEPLAEALWAV